MTGLGSEENFYIDKYGKWDIIKQVKWLNTLNDPRCLKDKVKWAKALKEPSTKVG